ncbi:central domain of glycogen debranching enzyme-domain-containing protein [Mycena olivaceomarginata]|nr:central domain of glycogen debranching enzyme-domain-containing protein [Mycena olivaceomarginata]
MDLDALTTYRLDLADEGDDNNMDWDMTATAAATIVLIGSMDAASLTSIELASPTGKGPVRAKEALADLNLVDLNVLLHCADSEERDASSREFGVYDVPGLGKMVYCGLEGQSEVLPRRRMYKDMCVVYAGLPMGLGACCGNSLGSYSAAGGRGRGAVTLEGDEDIINPWLIAPSDSGSSSSDSEDELDPELPSAAPPQHPSQNNDPMDINDTMDIDDASDSDSVIGRWAEVRH